MSTPGANAYVRLPIAQVVQEAGAIVLGLAVPEALRETFRFKPGQHLAVRREIDGAELRRTYSICAGPDDPYLRIAIRQVPGGRFSGAAAGLSAGDALEVMPPAGRFVLPPGDGAPRHVVALAAGSGITPILSILSHLLDAEARSAATLVYGNRSPATTMFAGALDDLKDRHLGRLTVVHVLSRAGDQDSPLNQGRIDAEKIAQLARRLVRFDRASHVLLCGPGSMIKEARNGLFALGVPRERVLHEFFAPGAGGAPGAPRSPTLAEPASAASTVAVTAILDGERHTFPAAAGEHLIDAALRANLRVPYSCRGGMCCTCRAKIVAGRVAMTVNYSLEAWEIERGFVLTCQAVAETPAVTVDYDAM